MRAVLFFLIAAILVVIAGVATGFLNVRQIRAGQPPAITATRSSITAKGGQPPAFDVETGSVKVGTKDATVKMPTLEVRKPGQPAAATNKPM